VDEPSRVRLDRRERSSTSRPQAGEPGGPGTWMCPVIPLSPPCMEKAPSRSSFVLVGRRGQEARRTRVQPPDALRRAPWLNYARSVSRIIPVWSRPRKAACTRKPPSRNSGAQDSGSPPLAARYSTGWANTRTPPRMTCCRACASYWVRCRCRQSTTCWARAPRTAWCGASNSRDNPRVSSGAPGTTIITSPAGRVAASRMSTAWSTRGPASRPATPMASRSTRPRSCSGGCAPNAGMRGRTLRLLAPGRGIPVMHSRQEAMTACDSAARWRRPTPRSHAHRFVHRS